MPGPGLVSAPEDTLAVASAPANSHVTLPTTSVTLPTSPVTQPSTPPNPGKSQAANQPDSPDSKNGSALKKVLLGAMLLALTGVAGYYSYKFYAFASTHEETDDAYVTAHLHQVSSRVNGTVQKVLVDDNDHVKAGQLLAELEPRDFEVRVEQAVADLETAQRQAHVADVSINLAKTTAEGQDTNASGSIQNAQAQISKAVEAVRESEANVKSMKSDFEAKKAEVERAELDYKRYAELEKQRAVTTSARDSAKRDFVVANENCSSAQEAITQSISRLEQA